MSTASTAVIYARYSSHNQRDVSIEQQVRACEQFAQRNSIEVLSVYEDRAFTGTNDKRPGFQQMIRDAKKNTWNYVIVYSLDRFARDRYDSAVYKRQLRNEGVKVLSAMENISDDPTGVLMESLLEGLAEYYSKELSQKIRRGRDDNARKCLVNSSLPLGYVKGPDFRYMICEPEAEIVLESFRRVKALEKISDIITDYNARGLKTKRGNPWNRSSFNQMLSNIRYTGVYVYGDIRVPGGIPAIVPSDLFNAVQDIIHRKPNPRRDPTGSVPQKRRRDNGVYLLTGKLFCGDCGNPMVGVSGTSHTAALHYYYSCKGRRVDHNSCTRKNIRRDTIEEFVAAALRDAMLAPEAIEALADAAILYQSQSVANNELASLRDQLAAATRSLNNLVSAIEAGIFSASTQERLLELEAQKRDLERLVSIAEADAEKTLTREEIIATLELFRHGDISDKEYQESMIDTFLVAAYVYTDRVKFIFTLDGGQKPVEIPFNMDDVDLSEGSYNEQLSP